MAKTAGKTQTVYLDSPLHVDLPATKESPNGRVVTLRAGYNEIEDPLLLTHPVVARLLPASNVDAEFNAALAQAARERDDAIAKAWNDYHEVATAAAKDRDEARAKAAEDWGKRRDDAINRNVVFTDPHPDPDTQRAQALTASPAHVYASSAMQQVDDDNKLKSAAEVTEQQAADRREETEGGHRRRERAQSE